MIHIIQIWTSRRSRTAPASILALLLGIQQPFPLPSILPRPICDANNQNCQVQTTPDPNAWTCPEAWGYFPDPDSCCYFYQCEDNVAYHELCPTANGEQLYYDETITACDFQDRVPCGSRPLC